jgi:ribulose-phosphate 3-epimerase
LWHEPKDLPALKTKLKIEAHLMINRLEDQLENWLTEPVERIVFHLEAAKDPYFIIQKCREAKKQVGIAAGPDLPWTQLMPFCDKTDLFQILAVYPGLPGQKFIEGSLQKIHSLRQNCPSVKIEVDGGVNLEVAKKAKNAGADIIISASYIFKSRNIGKAIEKLKEI